MTLPDAKYQRMLDEALYYCPLPSNILSEYPSMPQETAGEIIALSGTITHLIIAYNKGLLSDEEFFKRRDPLMNQRAALYHAYPKDFDASARNFCAAVWRYDDTTKSGEPT